MDRILVVLLLGLGFYCQGVTAQDVTIEGKVLDSLNNPLELANVIAINKNTKAMASYGITDSQGRFRLKLQKDSLYLIKASYLGYETWEETLEARSDQIKNIVLKPSPEPIG